MRFSTLNATGLTTAVLLSVTGTTHGQVCFPSKEAQLSFLEGIMIDEFGRSLAVSADVAVVGSPFPRSLGKAFIYRYVDSRWSHEAYLSLFPNQQQGDRFGSAVGVFGDTVVVGAASRDEVGSDTGAVFVFGFDGVRWSEESMLSASDAHEGDHFGEAIFLSDQVMVIGAADYEDDRGIRTGAAYVFRFDGSSWHEEAKFLPLDGVENEQFGVSVAMSGPTILVGAPAPDLGRGSVSAFEWDGVNWKRKADLLASDGSMFDEFGQAVALEGERAIVGAAGDDDRDSASGSAYIFRYDDLSEEWIQDAKLRADDGAIGDRFGAAVAIAGSDVLVGAPAVDEFWVDDIGAAYLFSQRDGDWEQHPKIRSTYRHEGVGFGSTLLLTESYAFIKSAAWGEHRQMSIVDVMKFDCSCLGTRVENFRRGEMARISVVGGTPGASAITVYGIHLGETNLDHYANYCATFGIGFVSRKRIVGSTNRRFDQNGEMHFRVKVPDGPHSRQVFFQSAQEGTCPEQCVSNVVDVRIR